MRDFQQYRELLTKRLKTAFLNTGTAMYSIHWICHLHGDTRKTGTFEKPNKN